MRCLCSHFSDKLDSDIVMSSRKREREWCVSCFKTKAQTGQCFAGCCSKCARHIRRHRLCIRCHKTKAKASEEFLGLCKSCYGECEHEVQCRKCGIKENVISESPNPEVLSRRCHVSTTLAVQGAVLFFSAFFSVRSTSSAFACTFSWTG